MNLSKIFLSKTIKSALLTAFAISSITMTPMSQADELLRLAQSLCEAAKTDDRTTMRKELKTARIRLRQIYSGIICGPEGSLLRVATNANSLEAATFIATKIGKSNLGAAEQDGKNIVQFTQGLIDAGDASKQAFVDLYNSKL